MDDSLNDDPDLIAELRGIRREGGSIRKDLESLKDEQQADRRTLRRVTWLLRAKFVTIVLLVILMFLTYRLLDRMEDERARDREAERRQLPAIQLIVLSASYQTEVQRLTTEIRVGEQTGQTQSLEVRRQRLVEVSGVIQRIAENLEDLQSGITPRNEIPTELSAPITAR